MIVTSFHYILLLYQMLPNHSEVVICNTKT